MRPGLICRDWQALLRTAEGTQQLREHQCQALEEACYVRGLFAALRVGAGKTHLLALLQHPDVMGGARVLILVNGRGAVRKTIKEIERIGQHYKVSFNYRVETYTLLTRDASCDLLDRYRPDVILLDEAQHVGRLTSSCTRRIDFWMSGLDCKGQPAPPRPRSRMAAMTGTFFRDSFLNFAHVMVWCLGEHCPFPADVEVHQLIASVVDEKGSTENLHRLEWLLGPGMETCDDARRRLGQLLSVTPGVIISADLYEGQTLTVRPLTLQTDQRIQDAFARLRDKGELPDGWAVTEYSGPMGEWAVARQMALGLSYVHDPQPDMDWFMARRRWGSICRAICEEALGGCLTELQAKRWVQSGACNPLALRALEEWLAIEPTYDEQKNRKINWLSTVPLMQIAARAQELGAGTIVWVEHVEFGETLARVMGWSYYGPNATSATGMLISDDRGTQPIVASFKACSANFNLQHGFHHNILCGPQTAARDWEQTLGRTHREDQLYPVDVEYVVGCIEHVDAIDATFRRASVSAAIFSPMKVQHCDFERVTLAQCPSELPAYRKKARKLVTFDD